MVNKSQLVEQLAEDLGHSKRQVSDIVESMLDEITRRVAKGEKVSLSGFGVFEKQSRASRVGRNPRTGETVAIKATAVPKFRPGADLKGVVNGSKRPPKPIKGAVKKTAGRPPTKKATAAKRAPAKKAPTKRAPAKRAPARKAPARKAPARKAAKKR